MRRNMAGQGLHRARNFSPSGHMSAKPSKKSAKREAPAASRPDPAETPAPTVSAAAVATSEPSWIDSADPRKRTVGKIVLVAVWIYVAALWLLALDQTFKWGIFGPKLPPLP